MNGLGFSVGRVLAGIDAAAARGFPVKVNCVVLRGVNEGAPSPLRVLQSRADTFRFIEFMDVGNTNHWSLDAGGARQGDRRADRRGVAP